MELEFRIKGIDCASCATELEEKINEMEGIEKAILNFLTEKLYVILEKNIDEEEMIKNIIDTIKYEEPDVIIEEL